uniref:CARMIL_C domain-containing protein n=1 Tax=Macrostomum lignano TaxID=282301 RepID=A0A1I8HGT8_9PLAT
MKRLNRCFELLTDRLIGFQSLPLRHLCIDGCGGLGGSGMGGGVGLENYLSRLGSLEHLSCVDCGLVVEPLTPVLLKLTHRLTHLDLSRNQYCPTAQAGHEHPAGLFNKFVRKPSITSKTADDASNGAGSTATVVNRLDIWAELFAECRSLRLVRLNRCRLPAAAAESLLVGLSRCGGGGGGGDSAKPAELSVELAGTTSAGAKLERNLCVLLNALGECNNLTHLDISENGAGELSAKVLAKALFVNSSLVVLQLDGNRIGAKGLRDIAESLRFNQTLLRLPVPVADVAASAGGSQQQQQLVQEALDLLQEGLVRNNQKVGRQVTAKDYRLHAELSNYQFTADNQIASASVSLAAVASVAATPETGRAEIDEHAERCRRAIKDAESAKRLLIRLQVDTDAPGGGSSGGGSSSGNGVRDAAPGRCRLPDQLREDSGLADSLKAQLHGENSRCRIGLARVAEALSRSAGPALAAELSVLKLNSALVITTHLQEVAIRNLHQSTGSLNSLIRNKVFVPTLRRNMEASQSGHNSRGRPLSLFPASNKSSTPHQHPAPDSPETLNEEDVEELSLSEDDWDPSKPTAALAHTHRPVGDKNRRLPTSRKQPPAPVNGVVSGEDSSRELPPRPLPQMPQTLKPLPPTTTSPTPPTPEPPTPPSPTPPMPEPPTPQTLKPLPPTPPTPLSQTLPPPNAAATDAAAKDAAKTTTLTQQLNPPGIRVPPGAVAIPGLAMSMPMPRPQQQHQQNQQNQPPSVPPKPPSKPLRKKNIDTPAPKEAQAPVPVPRKRGGKC